MSFILLIALFILLAILSNKMAKWCKKKAVKQNAKKQREEIYRTEMLGVVKGIHDAVSPAATQPPLKERLLQANQELMEKNKVRDAMRSELGVE